MPLFPRSPSRGAVPLHNSACPWASSAEDLRALWECPYTSAVTTRTTTLHGFEDDSTKHQVVFFGSEANSSANSYGYSPYPLSTYLSWLRPLVDGAAPAQRSVPRAQRTKKQLIVSITGTLAETREMLVELQAFADEHGVTLAAELNASCPNIKGHPPPAYFEKDLAEYLELLAEHASPTLKVGVKLPPYTYDEQFTAVVRALSSVRSPPSFPADEHPISFLTTTNTLGQGLVFTPQIVDAPLPGSGAQSQAMKDAALEVHALPGGWGGLAGAAVHQTSLGNIYRLSLLLRGSAPAGGPSSLGAPTDARLASVTLIGVGGASDAAGVERFRLAGADAVACATALGREGVSVFERMSGEVTAAKL
ncbi:hypothetical protein JCM8208_000792 [Rhodotorula glutinis]